MAAMEPTIWWATFILLVFGPTFAAIGWLPSRGRRRLIGAAWITAVCWSLLTAIYVWFVYSYDRQPPIAAVQLSRHPIVD